jgi:transposase
MSHPDIGCQYVECCARRGVFCTGDQQMSKEIKQYSLAFKQMVVSQIEKGKFSMAEAKKTYDIGGCETIPNWLRKFGKDHLLNRVVRIEMKGEKDRIKELERQKRELESALAQEHLKNICLESLIECVEEHYQIDVKKNFGEKQSKGEEKKQK